MFDFNSTIFHVPIQSLKNRLNNYKENAIIISSEFGVLAVVFVCIILLLIKFKIIILNIGVKNKIKTAGQENEANPNPNEANISNKANSSYESVTVTVNETSNNTSSINGKIFNSTRNDTQTSGISTMSNSSATTATTVIKKDVV